MSDILQKVVDTTNVGSANGGLLNTEQANRFIDYMFDATILARAARTVRMRSNTADIDKVGVGTRLMTVATEATQTGANAAVTFSKISLTTKKLRLDWELSSEALEDNIEGADLEDHIARLMATQAGNDIEDLLINGVGTGTSARQYSTMQSRLCHVSTSSVVMNYASLQVQTLCRIISIT